MSHDRLLLMIDFVHRMGSLTGPGCPLPDPDVPVRSVSTSPLARPLPPVCSRAAYRLIVGKAPESWALPKAFFGRRVCAVCRTHRENVDAESPGGIVMSIARRPP